LFEAMTQIIQNDDFETLPEKLNGYNASDVTGASGDQYALSHLSMVPFVDNRVSGKSCASWYARPDR
jgi:hypothetical protein